MAPALGSSACAARGESEETQIVVRDKPFFDVCA